MKRATVRLLVAVALCAAAFQPTLAGASVIPSWLSHLNSIRAMGGLSPVSENSAWSAGCYAHSRYMSLNRVITHSEDSSKPYYSAVGDLAARRSNLALGVGGLAAIDTWAVGPFHTIGMIDPKLAMVGFGSYEAAGAWPAATLDVIRGKGAVPAGTEYPVLWPGPGSVSHYLRYRDYEYPDPLAGTGFSKPSGAFIIAQFGRGDRSPVVSASSLESGGQSFAHKTYTELTYRNSNSSEQKTGRAVLGSRDAVVIVPKTPLKPNAQYDVALTVDGRTHAWSFTTGGDVDIAVRAPRTSGYAEPVDVSASFSANDDALTGKPVSIEQSADGVLWKSLESMRTCGAGSAGTQVAPVKRLFVRARFAGDTTLPARTSAPVRIMPDAKVGRPLLSSTVRAGRSIDTTGVLFPQHAAGSTAVTVYAQRYESGRWVTRARFVGYAASGNAYQVRVKLPYTGSWRLRAKHAADAQNGTDYSSRRYVKAR